MENLNEHFDWLVGLWCLTPLSTIFQLSYIVAISFIGGGKQECPEKTTHNLRCTIVLNLFKCFRDLGLILRDVLMPTILQISQNNFWLKVFFSNLQCLM
jgi:hypothetical protein